MFFNAMTVDFREDIGVQMAALPRQFLAECEKLLENRKEPVFS